MLVTAVGAGAFFGLWRPEAPQLGQPPESGAVLLAPKPLEGEGEDQQEWMAVHVAGRVVHPGLVRVGASARVGDAIMAAGGALPDARLGEINLAAPVEDGGRVVVPGPRTGWGVDEAWDGSGQELPDRVNVNRASAQELEEVPGLGPVLARRIVDYRESHGPFREVEDLLDVSGIGEKKLAGLREYVALP